MDKSDQRLPMGTFVYDTEAPWDLLRSGTTTPTAEGEPGVWLAANSVEELRQPQIVHPMSEFADRIRPHILMHALHGPSDDGYEPLRAIYAAALGFLRGAIGRTLALDELRTALADAPDTDAALVDEVLRMMGTMGVFSITARDGGFQVTFSSLLEEGYKRRDYLATFTNELMAKSRRIDLLIGHSGTVGNYREELLSGLLDQLLPQRYQATTGFIEGCPRQLDIIVWDAENYSPLFREQNFVVVPLASVRAVIEVKTTLSDGALRKGMEILWDTFRNRPTVVPIFTGIFAFEAGLESSNKVAAVMRSFYQSTDKTGLIPHEHGFCWSGINAVCVPGHYLVRERYLLQSEDRFPQPVLTGVNDPIGDDAYSALFLGILLSHLKIDPLAKLQNNATFEPVLRLLEAQDHGPIYTDWRPTLAPSQLAATLEPRGANTYVRQVHKFREGSIKHTGVGEGLEDGAGHVQPEPIAMDQNEAT